MKFYYETGKLASLLETRTGAVTPTALCNIARRPDLLPRFLRHLDLSGYAIPATPEGWKPRPLEEGDFWLGYYHEKKRGVIR